MFRTYALSVPGSSTRTRLTLIRETVRSSRADKGKGSTLIERTGSQLTEKSVAGASIEATSQCWASTQKQHCPN